MPATVGVNFMSVVHKKSTGTSIAFPDVCKTPSPGGPIPIPYPNITMSTDTAKGTKKVKCDGESNCVKWKVVGGGETSRCQSLCTCQTKAHSVIPRAG